MLIKDCLMKASDLDYKSIAFPALGAGAGGISPTVVATTMLQAIDAFCYEFPNNSLTDIRIIVKPDDTEIAQVHIV